MEGRNPRKLDRLWQRPSREHKVDVLIHKLLVHNVPSMKPKAPKWATPVVLLRWAEQLVRQTSSSNQARPSAATG